MFAQVHRWSAMRLRVAAVLGSVACAALVVPQAADAAVTCSFAGATLTVSHPDGIDTATLRVNGATIEVLDDDVLLVCTGSAPTTANTATINYAHAGGISDLHVVEPDSFVPGAAGGEAGASAPEIEINATESGGILSDILLLDGDGAADTLVIGTNGINFNPAEPATQDADITISSFFADLEVRGGAGEDVFDARGGAGTGAAGREVTLRGGDGNDQLFGSDGSDDIEGEGGDDTADGGAGRDSLDFSQATAPVEIDLTATGPQNAGSSGQDTLLNFDDVTGTPQNDVLRGTSGDNSILGLGGDDLVEGREGDDSLDGGAGTDTVSHESAAAGVTVDLAITDQQDTGGAGMDTLVNSDFELLVGSPNSDTLRGTDGQNTIDGLGGVDSIFAVGGDDTVLARDGGPDTADCGDGNDLAVLDLPGVDTVTACETQDLVQPPIVPPGEDTEAPAFAAAPTMTPDVLRAARSGPAVQAGAPVGATIGYSLSEAATVRFKVRRARRGRRAGGRCVRPRPRNRGRPRCVRFVRVPGSFRHVGVLGANSFRFTGRVGGRKLRRGRHRLVARAVDAAGNRSERRRTPFRIVQR
jgi:RTX calcium-binding nonapeptide repeat (4 copies)